MGSCWPLVSVEMRVFLFGWLRQLGWEECKPRTDGAVPTLTRRGHCVCFYKHGLAPKITLSLGASNES